MSEDEDASELSEVEEGELGLELSEEEPGPDLSRVKEEFFVWKKNTPILYDFVISHALGTPSQTVHWSPSPPQPYSDDSHFSVHRLVLGTHASPFDTNFLLVANAVLPTKSASRGSKGASLSIPKVEITQKILMDGEVKRARFMPQNHALVAVKTSSRDVYVVHCNNQAVNENQEDFHPDLRLRGHDGEGYGLSWSLLRSGYLLSASTDNNICIWDISAMAGSKVLDARDICQGHVNRVEDAQWHLKNEHLFASVGDDGRLLIWDLRTRNVEEFTKVHIGEPSYVPFSSRNHGLHLKSLFWSQVNSLSFNPYNEWIMATASSDTTVALSDMRKLAAPLHVLRSHVGAVFHVEWDPNHETVLASCSGDRRLNIWDINRIGDEQQDGDASDGPPELIFSHGGHKAVVSDFAWNKHKPWVISSVADDKAIQVWQMAETIYLDDDLLAPGE